MATTTGDGERLDAAGRRSRQAFGDRSDLSVKSPHGAKSPGTWTFLLLLVVLQRIGKASPTRRASANLAPPSLDLHVATNETAVARALRKFECSGPTLSITLCDPSRVDLSGNRKKLGSSRETFATKLAALFTTKGDSSRVEGFRNGFLRDDGDVMESSESSLSLSALGRDWDRYSLSECVEIASPEVCFDIRTRQQPREEEDCRPLPNLAPFLTSVSSGIRWSPLDGHAQTIRCGAKLRLFKASALWRRWRSTSRGIAYDFTEDSKSRRITRDVDLGVTYDGTRQSLELLLGQQGSDARPGIYETKSHPSHLLVRLATTRQTNKSPIEFVRGCFGLGLPFRNKSRISVTPSYDVPKGDFRCVISGDFGLSGQTRAVLRMEEFDSTLTLVRDLDERRRDSSLRAHVDPTKGIHLMWTDGKGGGSCWMSEARIPLGTSGLSPFASDIRVGRRWAI
ncbi:hypothetical protein THAOC_07189 [Thalassiosira oceanica]|uniref:Uncharacterized protein n=1 Tax=Thalassiosira oceanica TaxID=159749 RepID=K0T0X3_THAOC|nr:hypothetical protein THAOC_07189 [Thalassiosira oceanica]|eukprot:EJK71380.1 hypothetical protein THAOC_07189 [Thalassiosira oceanica]